MISTVFVVGLLLFWLATIFLIRGIDQGRSLWFWLVFPFFPVEDIRNQWWRLSPWVFLRLLGLAALLFSITLYAVQIPKVQHYLAAGQEAKEDNQAGSLLEAEMAMWRDLRKRKSERLAGVLQGDRFVPERAELIHNTLSIHTGNGLLPNRELRLVFTQPLNTKEPFDTVVSATDLDGPEVHMSWRDPEDGSFQTKILEEGYRLNLAWYPLDKNQLAAQLELVLPSEQMTYLAGDIFIHTNKLRFKYGQVDSAYDHEDTLVYLLDQRIENRYPSRLIKSTELLEAKMHVLQGTGVVRKLVTLENNRVEEWRLDFRKTIEGWHSAAGGLEVTKVADESETDLPETVVVKAKDVLKGRDVEFVELAAFAGQIITVEARDSTSLRQGVLEEVSERGILLRQQMGAGGIDVFFPAQSVISVELITGEVFSIARPEEETLYADESFMEAAEEVAPTIVVDTSSAEEDEEELSPYHHLLNRWVEVTDSKGRKRTGELVDVSYYISIHVPMGAGSTKYHYLPDDIESIEEVPRP